MEHLGIYVAIWRGVDGVPVVQIDTEDVVENEAGPVMRVNLNDASIYANPHFVGKEESDGH